MGHGRNNFYNNTIVLKKGEDNERIPPLKWRQGAVMELIGLKKSRISVLLNFGFCPSDSKKFLGYFLS